MPVFRNYHARKATINITTGNGNHLHLNHTHSRHVGDDDGFESLNGKSSSGEEMNVNVPVTCVPRALTKESKLRLRLNATSRGVQGEFTSTNKGELKSNIYYRLRMLLDKNRPSSVCDAYPTTRKLSSTDAEIISDTDEEGDDGETFSSPASLPNYHEYTTSATEWLGITTNS